MSALPIAQCAVAAGGAWFVASDLVGHARPFFAPIAAVISLGVSLGSRLRRVAELVVGVSLGVLVGDLLISQIGSGTWQIMLVVALAMAAAVFADGATLLVAQAGASAVLVATLLPPGGRGRPRPLRRRADRRHRRTARGRRAAVRPGRPGPPGGACPARRAAAVLAQTGDALRGRATPRPRRPRWRRARASQPLIDELRGGAARRPARSPASPRCMRRRRRVLGKFAELAERTDYAMRNTRVLVRRTYTALCDDEPAAPELADVLGELAIAVGVLTAQLGRDGDRARAREPVLDVVRHARALEGTFTPGPSEVVIVAQLRSIALDLLQATGMTRPEALAAMRGSREDE